MGFWDFAGDALGGLFGLGGGIAGAAFAAKEAQKQRDFQERMDNTRYQRTMADLAAADLNPMLVIGGARPPGAPAGASGASGGASLASGAAMAGKTIAEGVRARRMDQYDKEIKSKQAANLQAQLAKTAAETDASRARAAVDTVEAQLRASQLPAARAQAEFDATPTGKFLRELRRVLDSGAGALAAGAGGAVLGGLGRGRGRGGAPPGVDSSVSRTGTLRVGPVGETRDRMVRKGKWPKGARMLDAGSVMPTGKRRK